MTDFLMYNDSKLQMDSTLILCIEEHDDKRDKESIDTRLFVGWSNDDDAYFVRGKRQDIGNHEFVPYAFHFGSSTELYDFINVVVGNRKTTSIILYNYNNIDSLNTTNDKLTYEFFEENMDKRYILAAYDNVKLKKRQITKYLSMLKNTYNCDNSC
jgi:hypothetical protein